MLPPDCREIVSQHRKIRADVAQIYDLVMNFLFQGRAELLWVTESLRWWNQTQLMVNGKTTTQMSPNWKIPLKHNKRTAVRAALTEPHGESALLMACFFSSSLAPNRTSHLPLFFSLYALLCHRLLGEGLEEVGKNYIERLDIWSGFHRLPEQPWTNRFTPTTIA